VIVLNNPILLLVGVKEFRNSHELALWWFMIEFKGMPLKLDVVREHFTSILNDSKKSEFQVLVENVIATILDVQCKGCYSLKLHCNVEKISPLLFWRLSLCTQVLKDCIATFQPFVYLCFDLVNERVR